MGEVQRLGADHAAASVHLRLVVQRELCGPDRLAKALDHAKALGRLLLQGRHEDLDVVAPELLRPMQRHLRAADDCRRGARARREGRHTDAGREADHALAELDRPPQGAHDVLRKRADSSTRLVLAGAEPLQHQHEAIAPHVRHQRLAAPGFGQSRGHFPQQLVAHLVAQRVVDDLEVVEVAVEHRAVGLLGPEIDQAAKSFVHEQPVRKPRDGIGEGAAADAGLGLATALVLEPQLGGRGLERGVVLADAHDQVHTHQQRESHERDGYRVEALDHAEVDEGAVEGCGEHDEKVNRQYDRVAALPLAIEREQAPHRPGDRRRR